MPDKTVLVTTSWDDGHELDVRLADLLDRYGLAATFYVAPRYHKIQGFRPLSPTSLVTIAERFEIGGHTLTHPHLPRLRPARAMDEILGGKHAVEDVIGREITSFCYPYGAYRPEHLPMVAEAGFTAARTSRRGSCAVRVHPLEMPTTVHAARYRRDTWSLLRGGPSIRRGWERWRNWDVHARILLDEAAGRGGMFHLWGHSWEIEAHDDWGRLERFLAHLSARENVQFVTNAELAVAAGAGTDLGPPAGDLSR
ncbi:MAG TPA: polysaccharide deacetylase family protein [Acidimicrobiales bacterium]|nr:polysaccharide deacetylase family protein [Acidimicrobiales bacterium]HXZ61976.1 polysaccharide deacetylase family protein [Acidimicrobiales bacterium]